MNFNRHWGFVDLLSDSSCLRHGGWEQTKPILIKTVICDLKMVCVKSNPLPYPLLYFDRLRDRFDHIFHVPIKKFG